MSIPDKKKKRKNLSYSKTWQCTTLFVSEIVNFHD